MAVRALLKALWQALQPYHFWIGFFLGEMSVLALLLIDRLFTGGGS